MAIIQPLKKAFNWETVHEKIQNTPLYTLDWSLTDTVEVNSWRGIIDMENFAPGGVGAPLPSLGGYKLMKIKGPQVATNREQFYIQITPYYDISADAAIPYVMPVGFTVDVADIAIYNMAAGGDFDAPFYLYYELGVNYKG